MSYERMSSGRFIVYDDAVGYSGVLTIRRQPGASPSRKSVSSAVHGVHPCFVDHMIFHQHTTYADEKHREVTGSLAFLGVM